MARHTEDIELIRKYDDVAIPWNCFLSLPLSSSSSCVDEILSLSNPLNDLSPPSLAVTSSSTTQNALLWQPLKALQNVSSVLNDTWICSEQQNKRLRNSPKLPLPTPSRDATNARQIGNFLAGFCNLCAIKWRRYLTASGLDVHKAYGEGRISCVLVKSTSEWGTCSSPKPVNVFIWFPWVLGTLSRRCGNQTWSAYVFSWRLRIRPDKTEENLIGSSSVARWMSPYPRNRPFVLEPAAA